MGDELIPISDEQANAIQEAAKLGVEGIQALRELGGFLKEVFGGVPKNLIGLLGGDYIEYRRLLNLSALRAKLQDELGRLGVRELMPPRLTLSLPILTAAADESDSELQALWARLLAAAMDPNRSTQVRQLFIDIVKKMDPMDARALSKLTESLQLSPSHRDFLANSFRVSADEIEVSFIHLAELGCVEDLPSGMPRWRNVGLTAVGRELGRLTRR
jgi:hypothetical protein